MNSEQHMTSGGGIVARLDGEGTHQFEGEGHGSSVSFYVVAEAPGGGPPLHLHPYEETFIVQEGRVRFTVGDEEVEAIGGDVVVAPARTPHAFVNSGEGTLHMIGIHPLPRMEQEDLEKR